MSRKQIAASLGQVPAGPPPGMDYQAQLQQIARQRAIAQQLGQPPERISQAGGYVVPYSAGEGLARIGQAFVSKKMNDKLDTKEAAAQKQYQAGRAGAVAQIAADPTNPTNIQSARDFGLNPGDFRPVQTIVPPNAAVLENGKPGFTNTVAPKGATLPPGMRLNADGEPEWIPGYIAGRQQMTATGTNALADDESRLAAELYQAGVPTPQGGRGSAFKPTLRATIDMHPEMSFADIAQGIKGGKIGFGAEAQAARTAGGVAGRVQVAGNEISEMAPLVREAAAKVPRGQFLPLTRLLQTADAQLNDPNLRALKVRVNSILNAYDLLAARGGTDPEKRRENRALVTAADSPEALESALSSLEAEAGAADRAAQRAMTMGNKGKSTLPAGVTEDDITETMRANKLTREQVLQKLNARP